MQFNATDTKVVGLNAHVEKTPQHIHNIVGVDGREDEVTGQGGVDGDLRGFLVADFADQNFVWIVTQNGTEVRAAKVRPFFSFTGICSSPANLMRQLDLQW